MDHRFQSSPPETVCRTSTPGISIGAAANVPASVTELVESRNICFNRRRPAIPTADGICERDFVHVSDLAASPCRGAASSQCPQRSADAQSWHRESSLGAQGHRGGGARHGPCRPGDACRSAARRSAHAGSGRLVRVIGFTRRFSDLDTIVTTAWKARVKEAQQRGKLRNSRPGRRVGAFHPRIAVLRGWTHFRIGLRKPEQQLCVPPQSFLARDWKLCSWAY